MRLNANTKIVGQRVILVPYESKHVEKYHEWMKDEQLQELTASEPLSLEEEYAMQRSWREDEDKCTFLVLCRETFEKEGGNEIQSLVGDTNLFLHRDEYTFEKVAEAEIMIAEVSARGKRYGWEAMLLLLKYAQVHLGIEKFAVKIGMNNEKSLRMFGKMLFMEVSRSEVFREVTLERPVSSNFIKWLDSQVGVLSCQDYH